MRYIDADALIEWLEQVDGCIADGTVEAPTLYKQIITDIKNFGSADVVEVVRCKDCKHLTVVNNESVYARCEKTGYIFWSFETDTREHFCAYGERREE